ncbi:MAG: metallophosphoesterase [Bacteroidales bacterium]|nr:metallophosphoesterase [Bacteroidales bacterium]
MKFLVFYVFVLIAVGLFGTYIYFRIRPLLAASGTWQGVASRVAYVVVLLSFIIGFLLQGRGFYMLSAPFTYIGSWFLAVMLYLIMFFAVIDVARIVNLVFKADFLSFKYVFGDEKARLYSLSVCILTAVILIAGYFNAKFPVTKYLKYETSKNISQNFKFVLVSDVHLGMIHSDSYFERLKDKINAENPDFVVIAGDFFDGDPVPVINSNAGKILEEITTGCGIYAVNGNHEWIGNADVADNFLKKHGVTVLRDSTARLPFGVTIVGREDRSVDSPRGTRIGRKPLKSIIENINREDFSILLDHQPPRHYEEEKDSGLDLGLSGHTHAGGQLWPLRIFTKRIYENDFGEIVKNGSIFYTTSGYGTWGPPIRTSARPEIVVIEVEKK